MRGLKRVGDVSVWEVVVVGAMAIALIFFAVEAAL